jgi:hypothetical protein
MQCNADPSHTKKRRTRLDNLSSAWNLELAYPEATNNLKDYMTSDLVLEHLGCGYGRSAGPYGLRFEQREQRD